MIALISFEIYLAAIKENGMNQENYAEIWVGYGVARLLYGAFGNGLLLWLWYLLKLKRIHYYMIY